MAGPTLLILLLEVTGLGADLLYVLFTPGKTKWARRTYIMSAALLIAGVMTGLSMFKSATPQSHVVDADQPIAWIPASLYILFALTFFLIHPILARKKL